MDSMNKTIEDRLDEAIKNCGTYVTLDSVRQLVNDDCLIILKWIKTGKEDD